jgi:Protein of unknown function (DUF3467)
VYQRPAGESMRDDQEKPQAVTRPEGRYANYFEVGHNAFEFLLDFGQFYPGNEEPLMHTRVITSPTYAKAFLDTVRDSIAQYEATFGPIDRG